MTRNLRHISLLALTASIAACSTTRTVPEGDRLYTGHEIKWTEKKKPKDWSDLKEGMDDRVRPSRNRKFLGMPIKLWLYNLGNKPKGKGPKPPAAQHNGASPRAAQPGETQQDKQDTEQLPGR